MWLPVNETHTEYNPHNVTGIFIPVPLSFLNWKTIYSYTVSNIHILENEQNSRNQLRHQNQKIVQRTNQWIRAQNCLVHAKSQALAFISAALLSPRIWPRKFVCICWCNSKGNCGSFWHSNQDHFRLRLTWMAKKEEFILSKCCK